MFVCFYSLFTGCHLTGHATRNSHSIWMWVWYICTVCSSAKTKLITIFQAIVNHCRQFSGIYRQSLPIFQVHQPFQHLWQCARTWQDFYENISIATFMNLFPEYLSIDCSVYWTVSQSWTKSVETFVKNMCFLINFLIAQLLNECMVPPFFSFPYRGRFVYINIAPHSL